MERTQFAALILPSEPAIDPKVLDGAPHLLPIAGKSIHQWVVDAALGTSVRRVVVVSSELPQQTRDALSARLDEAQIGVVEPVDDVAETVAIALDQLGADFSMREAAHVLLLSAACPQVTSAEIRRVVDHHVGSKAAATISAGVTDPDFREPVVTRDSRGRVSSIVDAPIGDGAIVCVRADLLVPALRRSQPGHDFTNIGARIAAVLHEAGHRVEMIDYPGHLEILRSGASRVAVEALLRGRVISGWIDAGVVMVDPSQVAVDATVHLGKGVRVLPGTVLEGRTMVADGARLGPNAHLIDATIGSSATVAHAVVHGVEVPARTAVTPFTVLGSPAL